MTAVIAEQRGAVLQLTLNRPDSLNAINEELIGDMRRHLAAAADDAIRVVTIKGNGRGFCVGGDIRGFKEMLAAGQIAPEMPDRLHDMIEDIRGLAKPVIAVVHGPCAGAGFSLVMACDLAIAAENAKFNLAYSAIALSPDGSSTYFLPRHVGMKKATEMFFQPRSLSAHDVLELGLINTIVAGEELQSRANKLAQTLAEGPTAAFGRVKQLLNKTWDNTLHDQLALETKHIVDSSRTADFIEGITAFLEKRKAQFQGK